MGENERGEVGPATSAGKSMYASGEQVRRLLTFEMGILIACRENMQVLSFVQWIVA